MAEDALELDVLTEAPGWLAKLPGVVDLCRTAAARRLRRGRGGRTLPADPWRLACFFPTMPA